MTFGFDGIFCGCSAALAKKLLAKILVVDVQAARPWSAGTTDSARPKAAWRDASPRWSLRRRRRSPRPTCNRAGSTAPECAAPARGPARSDPRGRARSSRATATPRRALPRLPKCPETAKPPDHRPPVSSLLWRAPAPAPRPTTPRDFHCSRGMLLGSGGFGRVREALDRKIEQRGIAGLVGGGEELRGGRRRRRRRNEIEIELERGGFPGDLLFAGCKPHLPAHALEHGLQLLAAGCDDVCERARVGAMPFGAIEGDLARSGRGRGELAIDRAHRHQAGDAARRHAVRKRIVTAGVENQDS